MKLYLYALAAALLLIAASAAYLIFNSPEARSVAAERDFCVIIDAGHGGFDGGAVRNGVAEAPLNLAIAQKLQSGLIEAGVKVVMTRSDENALSDTKKTDMALRARLAAQPSDLLISIHQNAHTSSAAYGPTVYYKPDCEQSAALAECLRQSFCSQLDIKTPRETQEGDFLILKSASAPAVMVECGFLSNNSDLQRLRTDDYQQALVNAILYGVRGYFSF